MLTLFCSSSRLSRILFCSIMSLTLSIYFCLWMELDLNWSSSDLNLLICLCLSARPLSILRSWASLLLRACKLFNRSSLDLVIDSEISYCSFTISLQWVEACKMLKPTKILSISFWSLMQSSICFWKSDSPLILIFSCLCSFSYSLAFFISSSCLVISCFNSSYRTLNWPDPDIFSNISVSFCEDFSPKQSISSWF